MSKLVPPHGGKGLVCCLLHGNEREAELAKAAGLKKVQISDRAKGDCIMMGIGGFSPLDGFMTKADWKSVCENLTLADGTFWPVPITLDISAADAADIHEGDTVDHLLTAGTTGIGPADGQQAVIPTLIHQGLVAHGAGSDDPNDLSLHRPLAGSWIADLLTDGDRHSLLNEASQVAVRRVIGYATHGNGLAGRSTAAGQGDVEQFRRPLRILVKKLIEITHPVKQQLSGMLRFDPQVLLHHGGVGRCGR